MCPIITENIYLQMCGKYPRYHGGKCINHGKVKCPLGSDIFSTHVFGSERLLRGLFLLKDLIMWERQSKRRSTQSTRAFYLIIIYCSSMHKQELTQYCKKLYQLLKKFYLNLFLINEGNTMSNQLYFTLKTLLIACDIFYTFLRTCTSIIRVQLLK